MYNNAGYFCCEEGQIGYNSGNTDGCVSSTTDIPDGASRLAVAACADISAIFYDVFLHGVSHLNDVAVRFELHPFRGGHSRKRYWGSRPPRGYTPVVVVSLPARQPARHCDGQPPNSGWAA
ncbi:hypothetical protein F4809DRAFT_593642 [Biscogniauxia mediterranea]|nr:hypothetical protein F4809DRAFT_593642 [Biscogniauxia mediterranea]